MNDKPTIKSLYTICLETLILNSADIEDLNGVPFQPYILDLLKYIFSSKICETTVPTWRWRKAWKYTDIANLLGRIADAHGATLRQPQYTYFGSLRLTVKDNYEYMLENYSPFISRRGGAPQFITQLDLSMSSFRDEDVPNLKFMVNLMVLDLAACKITDYGVSHLSHFNQLDNNDDTHVGLPHLETLSLAYNQYITDGSLKHLSKMTTLWGIDLSTTNVSPDIAAIFMKDFNYVCNDETPPLTRKAPWEHDNDGAGPDEAKCAKYVTLENQREDVCPVHPLTLITHQSPFSYNKGNYQQSQKQQDERKGVTATFNEKLYLVLTKSDSYGYKIWEKLYDYQMIRWWTKKNRQLQPLVLTRPPLGTTTAAGKKRSFENMVGNVTQQRPSLSVKQSQTATSFIENFKW